MEQQLKNMAAKAIQELFEQSIDLENINIIDTRKEFEGDLTIVTFPIAGRLRLKPEELGDKLGAFLVDHENDIAAYNVVKGFLNLSFTDQFWLIVFNGIREQKNYGQHAPTNKKVVLEYCGPNTNKPLHLGHIRNMVIGYSIGEILAAHGDDVHKVNILNDRGIAICKSMLAWQLTANNATPDSSKTKGDHFVGNYYVHFEKMFQEEYGQWQKESIATEKYNDWKTSKAAAKKITELQAKTMLQQWENGNEAVVALWQQMNDWVTTGFQETYDRLGIDFEEEYKESEYYIKGKVMVKDALTEEFVYQKEDQSIWIDLTDKKLDHKILLRSDGTSVYLTQDLAVAEARYAKYKMDQSIYVVADEQNYHFQVLAKTLEKMNKPYSNSIFHLAYGMVDLPSGKMKSREGTTVDADYLIEEVVQRAKESTEASGKSIDFSAEDGQSLWDTIGIGAIKFYILAVSPKTRMKFNPEESVNLQGFTSPFIQYSYTRIQSIFRASENRDLSFKLSTLEKEERDLIQLIAQFPDKIKEAATEYDPSVIAHYAFQLAKSFNKLYAAHSILKNEDEQVTIFRLALSKQTGEVIKSALGLLGIQVPEKM
ncbi:UNVERIFIED_CONTAM: hypothetical protein GTU68_026956 [Idotea baltica]|nr:hypothetical protein [Idotea baltica]